MSMRMQQIQRKVFEAADAVTSVDREAAQAISKGPDEARRYRKAMMHRLAELTYQEIEKLVRLNDYLAAVDAYDRQKRLEQ